MNVDILPFVDESRQEGGRLAFLSWLYIHEGDPYPARSVRIYRQDVERMLRIEPKERHDFGFETIVKRAIFTAAMHLGVIPKDAWDQVGTKALEYFRKEFDGDHSPHITELKVQPPN